MTLPRRTAVVGAVLAALLGGGTTATAAPQAAPQAAPKAAVADADPLTVAITRVTPGEIPAKGRITVVGTVTNTSDEAWDDVRAYVHTSYYPMTSEAELAEQAATDATSYFGERLTAYPDPAGDLAPGESARFRLRVPRTALRMSFEPGVYWLGVQVLGEQEGDRDTLADGRDRTFVPLMKSKNPPSTTLAVVLPFRAQVLHERDGAVLGEEQWRRNLSRKGRLGRLLAFSRSAEGFPLTWLLDPALVDTARTLAAGNPSLPVAPAPTTAPTPSPTDDSDDDAPPASPVAKRAQRWLTSFTQDASDHDLLSLPYGDVDVAGAYLASYGDLVERATKQGTESLAI